jgi:hypothetical protein
MRPRKALRSELYRVLDAALSVDVVVQKQTESADDELVMIEAPDTPSRGDRAANVGRRDELAEDVIDALNAATIDPPDHRVVHWPEEPTDETPVGYDDGGDRALDLLLTYEIYTQIKATI